MKSLKKIGVGSVITFVILVIIGHNLDKPEDILNKMKSSADKSEISKLSEYLLLIASKQKIN